MSKPGWVDKRGSATARRRRRQWLLDQFGNGETAPCFECGAVLTYETLTVDRIVPGCKGGTYARSNIRPACKNCQLEQSIVLNREVMSGRA